MKALRLVLSVVVLLALSLGLGDVGGFRGRSSGPALAAARIAGQDARPDPDLGRLPLSFEENVGQAGGPGRFMARGPGYTICLENTGAAVVVDNPDGGLSSGLRIRFEGAQPLPRMTAEEKLIGVSNYFLGSDPAVWRTGVPQYAKIRTWDLYPGVDLVFYGNQRELEFDLIVRPGADPSGIALDLDGARRIEIDENGDLVADLGADEVRMRRPNVYQGPPDERESIDGHFILLGHDRVGFEIAAYDHERPLVIDPVLIYSTYFGSSGWDVGSNIAVDGAGNVYFAASTMSTSFPRVNPLQSNYGGGLFDVVVSKFNPDGSVLLFSTYFGGSGRDTGGPIAIDADGDIYLTGDTDSTNFPKLNPIQVTFGGSGSVGFGDGFVTKMKGDGTALIYSTYIGGSGDDLAMGIAVDAGENAYVMGATESLDFPVANAFQPNSAGGLDAFLAKINPAGSALVYSTYLGGGGADINYGFGSGSIAVTADGYPCVVGFTNSTNFPRVNAFQPTYGGAGANDLGDVFVSKFDVSGAFLVFSTFLGGADDDRSAGVAMDAAGNVFVLGKTRSTNFPTKNPYQGTHGGGLDAFVAAFSSDGTYLIYSTYLGGSADEGAGGIAVGALGNAYVSGSTGSANFPCVDPIQAALGGGGDAFVSLLSSDGTHLLFSTFLGGSADDGGGAIGLDADGNIYLTGGTGSSNFPTAHALYPSAPGGGDSFVSKIEAVAVVPGPVLTSLLPSSASAGDPGFLLSVVGSEFVDGAVVRWDGSSRPTTFVSGFEVDAAIDAADLTTGKTVMVTVRNPDTGVSNALAFAIHNPVPSLSAVSPACVTGGGAAFTLSVQGTNFVPNSVVRWNGSSRTTTYISSTELQAAILATDIGSGGEAQVTVLNPSPAGGETNAVVFPVSTCALSPTPASATVTAGQSATYTIQLTPQFGSFDSSVTFSSVGLPSRCTATFSPTSVTPGAAAAATTLTLATRASSSSTSASLSAALLPPVAGLGLLVLAFLFAPRLSRALGRPALRRRLAACALVSLIIVIGSCSAGGGDDGPPPYTGTPKGTHTITVQAVSGNLRVTTTISLVVQ